MSISLLERRRPHTISDAALKSAINASQLDTLQLLERFGWSLRFVRLDASRQPLAWVHDPDHHRMAVIAPDGQLDERPGLAFRA